MFIETPAFCEIEKKKSNNNLIQKNFKFSNDSVSDNNDLNLSLSDMKFIPDSELKTENNKTKINKSKSIYRKGKSHKKPSLFFSDRNIDNLQNNIKSLRFSRNFNEDLFDGQKEVKMCSDLLLLIKTLYKNCLITAEEKVEIKKLIISKSRKIIKFYINEFESIKNNNDKVATVLKNFI